MTWISPLLGASLLVAGVCCACAAPATSSEAPSTVPVNKVCFKAMRFSADMFFGRSLRGGAVCVRWSSKRGVTARLQSCDSFMK